MEVSVGAQVFGRVLDPGRGEVSFTTGRHDVVVSIPESHTWEICVNETDDGPVLVVRTLQSSDGNDRIVVLPHASNIVGIRRDT